MWFLGSVSDDANEDEWHVKLSMQGTAVEFKIDTGADITVMSEQTFLKTSMPPLSYQNTCRHQESVWKTELY